MVSPKKLRRVQSRPMMSQAGHVMHMLHVHGMRQRAHADALLARTRLGCSHYCRTLFPHAALSMFTGHAWLRVCCDRRAEAPPRSEIMFLLLVVILGNMFLLALRFDVSTSGTSPESPLERMEPGAILFNALETAVLSLVIRLLLVVLLRLGRPRPIEPLHDHDSLIHRTARRVWVERRREAATAAAAAAFAGASETKEEPPVSSSTGPPRLSK